MNDVDLDDVNATVDALLDHYEHQDMFQDILDCVQDGIVCLELQHKEYDVYVSTHQHLQAQAQHNGHIVYGNDDFDNDLVDALFWIVVDSPTGETHYVVTHAYVSTGEAA